MTNLTLKKDDRTLVVKKIQAALVVHASTHSDGGADEVGVENLATSGAIDTAPLSDGSGGLSMVTIIKSSEKAAANGVATLDGAIRIPIAQIPNASIPFVTVVADTAARLALTPNEGDEAIQADNGSQWIFADDSAWYERVGMQDPYTPPTGTFTVNGKISASLAANSEQFGANSTVTSIDATAIGANSSASFKSVSVGESSSAGFAGCVAVGWNSTTINASATAVGSNSSAGSNAVTLGSSAFALGSNSVAIGAVANASNTESTALGNGSVSTGSVSTSVGSQSIASTGCVSVGRSASTAAVGGIALGRNSNVQAGHSQSVAIGDGATSTASSRATVGSVSIPVELQIFKNLILSTSIPPSGSSDTGTIGEIAWDSNFIYIYVAANTWKRVAVSTWV